MKMSAPSAPRGFLPMDLPSTQSSAVFRARTLALRVRARALGGARSGLWAEYSRLIGELRPRIVIVENSPELLDGWMGDILGTLATLGYDAEWDCLPAAALGAPHDRDRLWLTAHTPELAGLHERHLRQELRRWLSHDNNPWLTDTWDAPEAGIIGMDDGIPNRVDRSARLGNAVVPQIPEMIGRAILAAETERLPA